MRLFNNKNKIFIIVFVLVLVLPWVAGGALRVTSPSIYSRLSTVETEKRNLQSIEWEKILDSTESISGYIDDRIPFRYTFISWYKKLSDSMETTYKIAADAIGQQFYVAETEPKAVSVFKEIENNVVSIIEGEEAALLAQRQAEEEAANANYFALHTYQDVIIAREGWLFLYGENEFECYTGANVMSEEEMANYTAKINELESLCQAQGKELYIYIAPNKSQVYYNYMPTVDIVNSYKREQQMLIYVQENSSVPYIYPLLEEMTASTYYRVYYKYDSHWNHLGGLYGVNALYAAMGIEQTDPASWITGTEDAQKYELYTYMGIPDSMVEHDDTDFIVDYRPDITVSGITNGEASIIHSTSNGANDKKLCLIGDSFRVNMIPYISKDFTSCTFCHRDYLTDITSDIKNSDIIVIEAVERYDYEAFNTVQRVINILR